MQGMSDFLRKSGVTLRVRRHPPDTEPVSGSDRAWSQPLHIDWLCDASGPLTETAGRLGMSSCPGRLDLGSTLEEDVQHLVRVGIHTVVTLVPDAEAALYQGRGRSWTGARGWRAVLTSHGLHSTHFPMPDRHPPSDLRATEVLCTDILRRLAEGNHVLVHCIGGWGRTGTVVSSLLTHLGFSATAAIDLVRALRNPRCVESAEQQQFVERYAQHRQAAAWQRYGCVLPRAQLAQRLLGPPLQRVLDVRGVSVVPLAHLASQVAQQPHPRHDLLVLSGELSSNHSTVQSLSQLPIDRAACWEGDRFRPIGITSLLADLST